MFKRTATPERSSASTIAPDPAPSATAPAAKGRPTPKRSAAQAARRTSVIEQGGRRSGAGRGKGREGRESYQVRREAMRRGDESVLGARDRGPVRRYVRDFVDARRNLSSLFMPVAIPIYVIFIFSGRAHNAAFLAVVQIALMAVILATLFDTLWLGQSVKRAVIKRFPGESTRGLPLYAMMRALQFRRGRIPGPRVSRGDKV